MINSLTIPQDFFKVSSLKTKRKKYKAEIKTAMDDTLSLLTGKRDKIVKFISPIYLKLLKDYLKIANKEVKETKEASGEDDESQNKEEKKKKSKIYAYYLKLINSRFFQKLLGFVERIASSSFIQEVFVFLILLRYGIFQFFIPILLNAVKDALTTLARYLPAIVSFAFDILNNKLPSVIYVVLKEFIHAFVKLFNDLFGTNIKLQSEVFNKVLMAISKILPYLVILAYILPKIGFIVKGFSLLFSAITFVVKALVFAVKIIAIVIKVVAVVAKVLFVIFSSIAGIVIAIIAAVTLLGYLIYKYWDNIKKWFSIAWDYISEKLVQFKEWVVGIWDSVIRWFSKKLLVQFKEWVVGIWDSVIRWFSKKLKEIQKFMYNVVIRPLKMMGTILYDYIIAPIKKIIDVIRTVKADSVDKISRIVDKVFNALSPFFGKINDFIVGITKIINDVLNYFRTVSDVGIGTWYVSWKSEDRDKLLKAVTPASELLKSGTLDTSTLQKIQARAKALDISPETLIAAVLSGLSGKLDIGDKLAQDIAKAINKNPVIVKYQNTSAEYLMANTSKQR